MKNGNRTFAVDGSLNTQTGAFLTRTPRRSEAETAWFRSREIQTAFRTTESCAVEFLSPLTIRFMTDDAGAIAFAAGQLDRFAKTRGNAFLNDDAIDDGFDRM